MRSSWPADRLLGWLLPVLTIVAEGALLAVIYIAVEAAIEARTPLLGTFELSAAAGLTALAARRRWIRPDDVATPFLALLLGLGVLGWLWSAEARDLVLRGNVIDGLLHHPGGWLMVVAGMRGVGRAEVVDDRALTRLVLVGIPALAAPWALGQFAPEGLRREFTDQAFVASLTFVTAGFIAAGLARLQEIGRQTGVDWRRDRSWLGTVLAVLVLVMGIGLPAAALLGLPGDAVARGILEPLLGALGYVLVAFAAVAAILAAILARAIRSLGFELPTPMTPEEVARLQGLPEYTIEQMRGPLVGMIVLWGVLIVVAIVLVRVWLRGRARIAVTGVTEQRSFRIPAGAFRFRRPPRLTPPPRRSRTAASDAVTAYLATLEELEASRPDSARAEHETPRAHALRVALGPDMAALQADYALARYGLRSLTDAEDRRGLGRWRRLRERLRSARTP